MECWEDFLYIYIYIYIYISAKNLWMVHAPLRSAISIHLAFVLNNHANMFRQNVSTIRVYFLAKPSIV